MKSEKQCSGEEVALALHQRPIKYQIARSVTKKNDKGTFPRFTEVKLWPQYTHILRRMSTDFSLFRTDINFQILNFAKACMKVVREPTECDVNM